MTKSSHKNATGCSLKTLAMGVYKRPIPWPTVSGVKPGIDVAVFTRVGPVYHACKSGSFWLSQCGQYPKEHIDELWHEFDLDNGHRVAFHESCLARAVKAILDYGKGVVIV